MNYIKLTLLCIFTLTAQQAQAGKERDAGFVAKIVEAQVESFIKTKLKDYMLNIIINHSVDDVSQYEIRLRYNKMLLNDLIGDIKKENYQLLKTDCPTVDEDGVVGGADGSAGRGDLYGPICLNIKALAKNGFHIDRIVGMAFHEYAHHTQFIDGDHLLAAYFTNIAKLGAQKSTHNNLAQVQRLLKIQKSQRAAYPCFNKHPLFMAIVLDKTQDLLDLVRLGHDLNTTRCHVAHTNLMQEQSSIETTPLMLATYLGRVEALKILVKNGADVWVKNNAGNKASDLIAINGKDALTKKQLAYILKKASKAEDYAHLNFYKAPSKDRANKEIYKQFRNGMKIKSVKFSRNRAKPTADCQIVFYDRPEQQSIATNAKSWVDGYYVLNGMDRDGQLLGYYLKCGGHKALLYVPPKNIYNPQGVFPLYGKIVAKKLAVKGENINVTWRGDKLKFRQKLSSSIRHSLAARFGGKVKPHKYDREVTLTLRREDYALLKIAAYINIGPIRDLYTIEFTPALLDHNKE